MLTVILYVCRSSINVFDPHCFFSSGQISSQRQVVQVELLLLIHQAHLKSNRHYKTKRNNSRSSFSKTNSKLSNFKNYSKLRTANLKNNVPTLPLSPTCRHLLPLGKELSRGRDRKMVCYQEGRDSRAREWKK